MYEGVVEDFKFVAYYLQDDVVTAIASCQMDPIVSKYAEHVEQGNKLYRKDLTEDSLAWSRQ